MKRFISIVTVAAMLVTPVAAFAEEVLDGTVTEIQGDIMLINEPVLDGTIDEIQGDIMLIDEPVFDGTIDEIQGDIMLIDEDGEAAPEYDKQILDGTLVSVEEDQLIINVGTEYAINLDGNTIVIDENANEIALVGLKAGAAVRVVASTMTTRSIPPQSYGFVVMVSEAEMPMFPIYAEVSAVEDGKFTTADGTYEVSMTEETQVVSPDGAVKNNDIVLFYTDMITFSIPAYCTASKVVVIGEVVAPEIEEEIVVETVVTDFDKVVVGGTEVATKVVEENGNYLLHVRAVCEAMGLEVAWDDTLYAVTVGTVPMGVNFKIGENVYNKARMMPFTLSTAPVLVNDELTYVPVDFFTEVLGATVTIVNGTLHIN